VTQKTILKNIIIERLHGFSDALLLRRALISKKYLAHKNFSLEY
tara:strand:+ start:288 stop:419 length:132 start_codon:yes stop_codon:yes gene_type:complete